MTTPIKRAALIPLVSKRPEKQQRTETAIKLPQAVLTRIFSFLHHAGELYAALRVCKQWEKVVNEHPSWQKLSHVSSLNLLFPHHTPSQKKQELRNPELKQALVRAQKCDALFRQMPYLSLRLKGQILTEIKPDRPQPKRLFCLIQERGFEGLKWLDTDSLEVADFPLDDYLNCVKARSQRQILKGKILSSKVSQVDCVDDRFLIVMAHDNETCSLIIIDRIARKQTAHVRKITASNHLNFSKFIVWNDAIIFQQETRVGIKFQYCLFRVELRTFMIKELADSKCLLDVKLFNLRYSPKENFIVIDRESNYLPILVYDKKFNLSKFPPGDRPIGIAESTIYTFNVHASTFNEYIFKEGQWFLQVSDSGFGVKLASYLGKHTFSPPYIFYGNRLERECGRSKHQFIFFNLKTRTEILSFSFPLQSLPPEDVHLKGDYFLFSARHSRGKRLHGGKLGEPFVSIPVPYDALDIGFHLFEKSLWFEGLDDITVFQFEDPEKRIPGYPLCSPISELSKDIFQHIFSWMPSVKDHLSSILVSKLWKTRVTALPQWQLFKKHFLALSLLFPGLSKTQRKNSLSDPYLKNQLEMGEKPREIVQGHFRKVSGNGVLFLGPAIDDKANKRKLCWIFSEENPLRWLDLANFQFVDFPISKYADAFSDSLLRQKFIVTIQNKVTQLNSINDRYLIVRNVNDKESSLYIVDSLLKRLYFRTFTAAEKSRRTLSDYVLWRNAIVYEVDFHEADKQESKFYSVNLEDFSEVQFPFSSSFTPESQGKIFFETPNQFLLVRRVGSFTRFLYDEDLKEIAFPSIRWHGCTSTTLYMFHLNSPQFTQFNYLTKESVTSGVPDSFILGRDIDYFFYMNDYSPFIVKVGKGANGWVFKFYNRTLDHLTSLDFLTSRLQKEDLKIVGLAGDCLLFMVNTPEGSAQLYMLKIGDKLFTPFPTPFQNPISKVKVSFNQEWGLFVQDGEAFAVYSFTNQALDLKP